MCNVYMRPWTLNTAWHTVDVPFLGRLAIPQDSASEGGSLVAPTTDAITVSATRSHTQTWNWYIRGHVVSKTSRQYIINLLNACCIQNPTEHKEESDEEEQQRESSEESDGDGARASSTISQVLYGKYEKDAASWWGAESKHEAAVQLGRKLWETPASDSHRCAVRERRDPVAKDTSVKELVKEVRKRAQKLLTPGKYNL